MRSLLKILVIGTAGLTVGSVAQAADLPRSTPSMPLPPPIVQSPAMLVDEFSSGWYLRGDVGYRMNRVDSVTNADVLVPVIDDDIEDSWLFGVGFGFKWEWFRADITADYGTKAEYFGSTADLVDDFTAKIDNFNVLVNVYGDLGTWFGLTPYIGAGIGGSYVRTSDFSQSFLPAVGPVDDTSDINFAWAWMAGVSYKISSNYQIDLGYRHINMGDVTTGADAYGNQLTFHKLAADEFRVGLRYILD